MSASSSSSSSTSLSRLSDAIISGHVPEVRRLIEEEDGKQHVDELFLFACHLGRLEVIRYLLESCNPDLSKRGTCGSTGLHQGVMAHNHDDSVNVDVIRCLISAAREQGIPDEDFLHAKDEHGLAVFDEVCMHGNLDLIRMFVEEYQVPVRNVTTGWTITEQGHLDMVLRCEVIDLNAIQIVDNDTRESAIEELHLRIDRCLDILIAANPHLELPACLLLERSWDRAACFGVFMHWVAHYNEDVHGVNRQTTFDYPVHALVQCYPLYEEEDLWEKIFSKVEVRHFTSKNEEGLLPLQVYLRHVGSALSSVITSSPPCLPDINYALIQALLDKDDRSCIFISAERSTTEAEERCINNATLRWRTTKAEETTLHPAFRVIQHQCQLSSLSVTAAAEKVARFRPYVCNSITWYFPRKKKQKILKQVMTPTQEMVSGKLQTRLSNYLKYTYLSPGFRDMMHGRKEETSKTDVWHPKDLVTVRRKVEDGVYHSVEMFANDMQCAVASTLSVLERQDMIEFDREKVFRRMTGSVAAHCETLKRMESREETLFIDCLYRLIQVDAAGFVAFARK